MKAKRIHISAVIVAIVATLLAACGGSNESTSSDTQTATSSGTALKDQLPEELRAGMEVPVLAAQPPFAYQDKDGKLVGVDADLLNAISREIGVPIKLVSASFDNMLLGIESERWPFSPTVNITAERMEVYDYVSYWADAYSFGTLDDRPDIGKSKMDLCGLTLSAVTADVAVPLLKEWSQECTAAGKKPITVLTFPNPSDALLNVTSGRSAATVTTVSTIAAIPKRSGQTWKVTGFEFNRVVAGYAFPKGSDLPPVIEKAVNNLIEDGTYGKIITKYATATNEVQQAEINPAPAPASGG